LLYKTKVILETEYIIFAIDIKTQSGYNSGAFKTNPESIRHHSCNYRKADLSVRIPNMWILLGIAVLIMTLVWDNSRKQWRVNTFEKSRILGPFTIPIVGNGLQALTLRPESELILKVM